MRTFTDGAGRTWTLSITIGSAMRVRDRWARTALLCTVIANAHRDPKKGRSFKVDDFSPYKRESTGEVIRVNKDNIGKLKEAFAHFG